MDPPDSTYDGSKPIKTTTYPMINSTLTLKWINQLTYWQKRSDYTEYHLKIDHTKEAVPCSEDNQWITPNYKTHIQEAVMKPDHLQWFKTKYNGTDKRIYKSEADYNNIYWKGIGQARKHLNDYDNVRIMKLMNGWLNSGRQKGLFGKDTECPACGYQEENQLHIFQCKNKEMEQTRKSAFKLLGQYYHEHNVPGMVYVPFIKLCWSVCDKQPFDVPGPHHHTIEAAIKSQQTLGG